MLLSMGSGERGFDAGLFGRRILGLGKGEVAAGAGKAIYLAELPPAADANVGPALKKALALPVGAEAPKLPARGGLHA